MHLLTKANKAMAEMMIPNRQAILGGEQAACTFLQFETLCSWVGLFHFHANYFDLTFEGVWAATWVLVC